MPGALRKLDPLSRHTLRWTARRAALLLAIWCFPWLAGSMEFAQILAILPLAFTIAAVFAMSFAIIRRERIGASRLNTWDEAVLFCGLASLIHAVHGLAY